MARCPALPANKEVVAGPSGGGQKVTGGGGTRSEATVVVIAVGRMISANLEE